MPVAAGPAGLVGHAVHLARCTSLPRREADPLSLRSGVNGGGP